MDVRFCEGRNHRREARVRAAGSARVRRARSSEARLRRIFFSLTKTYMEVGKPKVIMSRTKPVAVSIHLSPLAAEARGLRRPRLRLQRGWQRLSRPRKSRNHHRPRHIL